MATTRTYGKGKSDRGERTRERIMGAVRELLAEGAFHEASVEQVAERAGVSRATVYLHFHSRVDLVDAMCDTFDANPALIELRKTVELEDAAAALGETIALTMRFWASEDAILRELYGAAALDPAARELVDRQRRDRRGEMQRLVANLRRSAYLAEPVTDRVALAQLMVLTSYETFRELREAGLSERALIELLQGSAEACFTRRRAARSSRPGDPPG
jgi:AcrR family transcriptional regulator